MSPETGNQSASVDIDWAATEAAAVGPWIPHRPTRPIVSAEGCWLVNDTGHRYLDLTSGHGVASLGHAHPELVAAIKQQVADVMVLTASLYSQTRAELLALLGSLLPAPLSQLFLCNSGTEAIEAGLKLAHLATERPHFVAFKSSFHGRSLGSLSVTWNPKFRRPFAALLNETTFVAAQDLEALDEAIDDSTAAVLLEVVQGEGGVNPLDAETLDTAQRLCRERGALLLIDEIQTGFGRTGSWFAFTEMGLEPDLVAMAKGLAGGFPIGALAYTPKVAAALFPGAHGTTFGGNPLACAAGKATLEILKREQLPERSRRLGETLLTELRSALGDRTIVRDIRGRGLMVGIELRQRAGAFLQKLTTEHDILALAAGDQVIRLLPPLVVSEEELDLAVRALADVLPA